MGWKAGVSSLQLGRAGSTVQARNPSDGTSEEPESVLRLLSHMTRESVSGGDKRKVLTSLSERKRGRCKGRGRTPDVRIQSKATPSGQKKKTSGKSREPIPVLCGGLGTRRVRARQYKGGPDSEITNGQVRNASLALAV